MSKDDEEYLKNIITLIHIFDAQSVFRKTNPEVVDDLVKKIRIGRISDLWKEVRKDFIKITYYPYKIPNVPLLMQLMTYTRLIGLIGLILMLIPIGVRLHPRMFSMFLILSSPTIILIFLIITTVGLFSSMILDIIIRRTIARHEVKDYKKYEKSLKLMKDTAQKIIYIFIKEKKRRNVDKVFEVELYHPDYKGIKLVKSVDRYMKIFKKGYKTYIYHL